MTKDEALKLALEALEESCYPRMSSKHTNHYDKSITAIKEALAPTSTPCEVQDELCSSQKPLAKVEPCEVCGEGKARLSVLRSCDTCHSEYAGQAEMQVALARDESWSWVCNECGAREFTSAVLEADLEYLACAGCGCSDFHKEALAQPEQSSSQEPVYLVEDDFGLFRVTNKEDYTYWSGTGRHKTFVANTVPPKRPWVGLTDAEWMNIVNKDKAWFGQRLDEVANEVAKLVEAKLKEKNA